MTRPAPPRPLRVVRAASAPVDELLAALDQWAHTGASGEPIAYLEVGDGELLGEFLLTAASATQLAALLRAAAPKSSGPNGLPGAAARPVTGPGRADPAAVGRKQRR